MRTEQGNPRIYIQANESQETYGGNVFVVDEVTGRMYVLRGDTLERIPEVASHRRWDELSPECHTLNSWGECRVANPCNREHPSTSSRVHSTATEHPQ